MTQYPIGQRYLGSGVTMPGIAGEWVPRGATVYMSAVDGLWYLADSDAAATLPAVGIVSDAGVAGNVIQILVLGIIERSDWTWNRGDTLYTSGVAGVMNQVAPANTQPVAVALTATLIYVNTTLSVVGAGGVAAHVLATTGPHTATLPLIDLEVGVQGEIIHRGAVDWEALGVGAAGQILTSGGAGVNVSWGAAGGGTGYTATALVTIPAFTDPPQILWNHAQATIVVDWQPQTEPRSYEWCEVVDANNIIIHMANIDMQNAHIYRVFAY